MSISAEAFITNAETFLPAVEMMAKITGLKLIGTIASVLRRAVQTPEAREQLIIWLKWTPIFGATPNASDPSIPAEYSDLEDELIEFKAGCAICDIAED